jgi:phosphatidate cytidylyltransferase
VLKQRLITALVLVGLALGALAWSQLAFIALMTIAFLIAQAEWLRLSGWSFRAAMAVALVLGLAQFAFYVLAPERVLGVQPALAAAATTVWAVLGAMLLASLQRPAIRIPTGVSRLLAWVLPSAAWAAGVVFIREGAVYVLSVLVIVWLADISAYFAGRAFGRRKLAPHISPGKTWAGVWGAIGGVVAVAVIVWLLLPDAPFFSNRLLQAVGVPLSIALLASLVAISIVGDLTESLLKRQAGAKDSSNLLPGHGGFFDRLDSLLAVLPAAALIRAWAF